MEQAAQLFPDLTSSARRNGVSILGAFEAAFLLRRETALGREFVPAGAVAFGIAPTGPSAASAALRHSIRGLRHSDQEDSGGDHYRAHEPTLVQQCASLRRSL